MRPHYFNSPVEKVGADHESGAALARFAVNHRHVLFVLTQPPEDVRVEKKRSGSKPWPEKITPWVMMVINLFQTAGLNCNLI